MVNAELQHNPYLLETEVKFNGQNPKINSQIEKYENKLLADWVKDVPRMFYDEMNGYDFDLFFSGTEYDFQKLQQTFISMEWMICPLWVSLAAKTIFFSASFTAKQFRIFVSILFMGTLLSDQCIEQEQIIQGICNLLIPNALIIRFLF